MQEEVVNSLRGELITLLLFSVIFFLQTSFLYFCYRYYYYGGTFRLKGGGGMASIDAGDPIYLIVPLVLIPFALGTMSNLIKHLVAIIKLLTKRIK